MRRPELAALELLASRRGQRVWIVGGALRDLLAGRTVRDVDVAIGGDAAALAQAIEDAGLGTNVPLSDVFPRVFRVVGKREIDVAELTGGSIEADLARRDFTVNAIACEPRERRWTDPFGGADDLARRRLRLVSARSLREDPLRILRAARLLATHGLVPDRAVAAEARRAAPGLAAVAPERIRAELVKLLEVDRAEKPMRWLAGVSALPPALGLAPAGLRTGRFTRALARLDGPSIRKAGFASRRLLRLCVIAHGLALSPAETARWLAGRRFSRQEAGDAAALAELAASARRAKVTRDQWAWIRDAGDRRGEALALLEVLFPARRSLARQLRARRPSRKVRLRGSDLMLWLQIPPGPLIGALLREIEIEAMRGAIRSRRQARRWLLDNRDFRTPGGSKSQGSNA